VLVEETSFLLRILESLLADAGVSVDYVLIESTSNRVTGEATEVTQEVSREQMGQD